MVMFVLFKKDRAEVSSVKEEETETEQKAAKLDTDKKSEEVIKKQLVDSQALKEKASTPAISKEQIDEVQKQFSNELKQLGACLGIQPAVDAEKVDPTFDNLIVTLSAPLGDIVVKMDDWTQLDVKAADGSLKRIRTEVEYQENGTPIKRAQLYRINEQGMPEQQQLNIDQATDPTDQYLDGLKGDSQTILEEKGSRVYYAEGEELVLIERGGKIQSYSLTKGEKTFSCTETDAITTHCQCL